MSVSYNIYKSKVQGPEFEGLALNLQEAFKELDKHIKKPTKPREKKQIDLPISSKTYSEYCIKHKNAKDFSNLPDKLKKVWMVIDNSEDSLLVPKEAPVKKEKKIKTKSESKPEPKKCE